MCFLCLSKLYLSNALEVKDTYLSRYKIWLYEIQNPYLYHSSLHFMIKAEQKSKVTICFCCCRSAQAAMKGAIFLNPSLKKDTIWTPTFISIFIANFATQMGQFMMNTLIPKYVNYLGATASVVGMVTSMFAVTALALRPITGPAFDYFSKKKLYMLSVFTIVIAFIGYSTAQSVPVMVVFRLLHGIGIGCTAPLGLAIASDSLPSDKIGSGVGIFSLGQAVASAIGPSIGLSLAKGIGYSATFMIGAAVMGIACALCFFIKDLPVQNRGKFKISPDRIFAKQAILPAVLYAFVSLAYSCINSFIAIYGDERGVEQIGLFFTAYALVLIFSRPMSGSISDRFGVGKVIVPGCLLFALSFFIISFASSLPMFLLAGAVSACGYGALQPAVQALCMRSVPRDRRGAAANTNYAGADVGQLLGPVISGRIVELVQASSGSVAAGYAAMYRWMTIPIGIALLLYIFNAKAFNQKG